MAEKCCFQARWASFFAGEPLEGPRWANFFAEEPLEARCWVEFFVGQQSRGPAGRVCGT